MTLHSSYFILLTSPYLLHTPNMVIGLTGAIGCGKSTVGRLFSDNGLSRIDCDEIVRELLASDPEVISAVVEALGPSVLNQEGGLVRRAIASIVFADRSQLTVLEAILHPRVSARWKGAVAADPDRTWVVEIPLLFEKNLQKWFDFTICLACDRETQLERLTQRGMAPEEADQRIAVQLPLVRKVELADHILLNNGSLPFLSDQIHWLIQTRNLI